MEPNGSYTMCCGKKDCPNVRFLRDGSALVTDTESGVAVPFTSDQLDALAALLALRTR